MKSKPTPPPGEWKLEIHQLDVGQGDAAIILFKKKNSSGEYEIYKSILIDCGEEWAGKTVVLPYLRQIFGEENDDNRKQFDAVIITHEDADHIDGFTETDISKYYAEEETPTIGQTVENVATLKNRVEKGGYNFYAVNNLNKSIWDIWGIQKPDEAPDMRIFVSNSMVEREEIKAGNQNINGTLINQYSVGCLISFGDFSFYTAGDIGKAQEQNRAYQDNILHNNHKPSVTKISHHASKNSTPDNFLDGTRATIISHGNCHGHPHVTTIDQIRAAKVNFTYLTNPDLVNPENLNIREDHFGKKTIVSGNDSRRLMAPNSKVRNKKLPRDEKGHIIVTVDQEQSAQGKFNVLFKRQRNNLPAISQKDEYCSNPSEFSDLRIGIVDALNGKASTSYVGMEPNNKKKKRELYKFQDLSLEDLAPFCNDQVSGMELSRETITEFVHQYRKNQTVRNEKYKLSLKVGRNNDQSNPNSTISFKITTENDELVFKKRFFKDEVYQGRVIARTTESDLIVDVQKKLIQSRERKERSVTPSTSLGGSKRAASLNTTTVKERTY